MANDKIKKVRKTVDSIKEKFSLIYLDFGIICLRVRFVGLTFVIPLIKAQSLIRLGAFI